MNDVSDRRYAASPLPTAEEVLAGRTQGGVPAPAGFFSAADLSEPETPLPTIEEAGAKVMELTLALQKAQDVWFAAMSRERG